MRAISLTKNYKCTECKAVFIKERLDQKICLEAACAISVAEKNKAKRVKVARKETKVKLKVLTDTKPKLTKAAQKAFNTYIRQRDYGKPCICCDKPIPWGTESTTGGVCDAGHYMSRGAHTQHKFNEDNVHAQRKHCNSPKGLGGNYANYRIGLIKRIGLDRVEALECDHTLNHFTKDELRAITDKYKQMTKELQQ